VKAATLVGKTVDYQGQGTGRPIKSLLHDGKLVVPAVTIASNGFIMGMNVNSRDLVDCKSDLENLER